MHSALEAARTRKNFAVAVAIAVFALALTTQCVATGAPNTTPQYVAECNTRSDGEQPPSGAIVNTITNTADIFQEQKNNVSGEVTASNSDPKTSSSSSSNTAPKAGTGVTGNELVCGVRLSALAYEPKDNYLYVKRQRAANHLYAQYKYYRVQATAQASDFAPTGVMLGSGHYGDVYLYRDVRVGELRVVKVDKDGKWDDTQREVSILRELQGVPSIPELVDVYFNASTRHACLVYRLVSTWNLQQAYKMTTPQDVQWIMTRVLTALAHAHARGIVHRDVKLANIVVDLETRALEVIDWGHAEHWLHSDAANSRPPAAAKKRAPQGSKSHTADLFCLDFTRDTWGAGIVFGTLILRKRPLFQGNQTFATFEAELDAFARKDLNAYAAKFNVSLEDARRPHNIVALYLRSKVTKESAPFATDAALDLLQRLLELDHTKRISPSQALEHAYFARVVNDADGERHSRHFYQMQLPEHVLGKNQSRR